MLHIFEHFKAIEHRHYQIQQNQHNTGITFNLLYGIPPVLSFQNFVVFLKHAL